MELDPSKPSYPSVIHLSFGSSASSTAGQAPPPVRRHGFIRTVLYHAGMGMPGVEDVKMMHLMASRTDIFHSTDDLDSTCRAGHDDSPFVGNFRAIISLRHVWVAEVYDVFPFRLYIVRFHFGGTGSR